MSNGRSLEARLSKWLAVQTVFEDGLDTLKAQPFNGESTGAGSLQPLGAVESCEAHDPKA
jgi:hypothetical protein